MIRTRVPVRVRGYTRWSILDELGRVEKVGPWRPNLITDHGLDKLHTHYSYFVIGNNAWRNAMHVGDGSTTPAAGDTTLDNELGTTTDDGGFASARVYSESGGVVQLSMTGTWVYTNSSGVGQNLSEYGFSAEGEAGLVVRELFRDGASNPITITLLDGKKLRMEHEQVLEVAQTAAVAFDVEEYDTGGSLVATESYTGTLYVHYDGNSSVGFRMFATARGINQGAWVLDTRPTIAWDSHPAHAEAGFGAWASFGSYTPGSFTRQHLIDIPEADATGVTITGFGVGEDDATAGWTIVLDDPQTIPKDDLHTLQLVFEATFARA